MHGGAGQVEARRQVAEAEAAGALEGEQDADGSVDALDHGRPFAKSRKALDDRLTRD